MVPARDPRRSHWVRLSQYSALALTLAFCVLIGIFGGRWVGRKLGSEELGLAIGLILGVVAAGVELFRAVREIDRYYGRIFRSSQGSDSDDKASGPDP